MVALATTVVLDEPFTLVRLRAWLTRMQYTEGVPDTTEVRVEQDEDGTLFLVAVLPTPPTASERQLRASG